jgi:prepilin-type N-terminal cleavage/methylation domain-containing protein
MASHPPSTIHHPKFGFTLVELLVVITIIGILIALLLPAVQAAREAARKTQCMNNFKQVGLALHLYHQEKGRFPPGMFDKRTIATAPGWFGWATYLLPFIELQGFYDQIDFTCADSRAWGYAARTSCKNYITSAQFIGCYQCPSDPQCNSWVMVSGGYQYGPNPNDDAGYTSMCAVSNSTMCFYQEPSTGNWCPKLYTQVDGIFGGNGSYKFNEIKDGTSNTLMIGEFCGAGLGTNIGALWACNNIMHTGNGINGGTTIIGGTYPTSFYLSGFGSYHPGGCHFTMADASVQFLSQHISAKVLAALTTRAKDDIIAKSPF